jgi:hypothetical protein
MRLGHHREDRGQEHYPLLSLEACPHVTRCALNARILLVIQFPRDTATVTALDAQDFGAFNDSICEALFLVFGG